MRDINIFVIINAFAYAYTRAYFLCISLCIHFNQFRENITKYIS